jgi:hypothetical protein
LEAEIQVIQGVMAVNKDQFDTYLDIDAENLAYKLEQYIRGKDGHAYEPICLNHSDDRYYYSILHKKLILINGKAQMWLLPWGKDENGQVHVYSHYFFSQGVVFKVPEEEIVHLGFN